ncbi:hypothetical protein AB0425_17485 [Actinosynnema sp. NPDC051121]
MPYTRHGHWFGEGEPTEPKPKLVARCGGPSICSNCAQDAAAAGVFVVGPASITGVTISPDSPHAMRFEVIAPRPALGATVHYVSHGTPHRPDGSQAFESVCRAATVTEVGAWITVGTTAPESFDRSEGRPIRLVEQWWYGDAVSLQVHNPTGLHLHTAQHDEQGHAPGTWHWPERV